MRMSLCNDTFFERTLSWDTESPVLSHCFRQTVLRAAPCLLLWLLAPIDLLSRPKSLPIRWSWISVSRLLLSFMAMAVSGVEAVIILSKRGYQWDCLSDPWTPVIVSMTYLLLILLTIWNKRRGFTRSSAIWSFLFLSSVTGGVNYYHLLRSDLLHRDGEYVTGLIFFPVLLLLLITSSITEPYQIIQIAGEKPCVRDYVSTPCLITYAWVDRLMYNGYKRATQVTDLFGLPDSCRTRYLGSRLWRNLFKKQEDNGQIDVSRGVGKAMLWTFKSHLFESGIFKLCSDAMGFVPPLILKALLTFVSDPSPRPTWQGVLIILLMAGANIGLFVAQNAFFESTFTLGLRVKGALMTCVHAKAMSMSNESRKQKTVGEIVNLMSVDSDKFNMLMGMIHLSWAAVLQICVAVYLLFQELGYAAFAGVASILLIMPFNAWITRKMKQSQTKQMKLKDERVKSMGEILNGILVLKLNAWEEAFAAIVARIRNQEMSLIKRIAYFDSLLTFSFSFTPTLVTLITFSVYSVASQDNVLDPAKLFFSMSIFNILRMPLINLPYLVMSFVTSYVSLKRLNSFFSAADRRKYVIRDKESEDAVSVKDALLSWSESPDSASDFKLEISDFKVKEGSLVAVVGVVGSGKSSLLSALLGEMCLTKGSVCISPSVRHTAFMGQQAWIQNLTLQQNILFGKELDQESYDKIVSLCELLPDLSILPAGDQTEIGEKGVNLSGGQKQRVSLARACYSDADLVLMDDPLSAVDAHVGRKIFDNIISSKSGLLKNKTRILVTNSLSVLPNVDVIYVLKDGRISESGSYEQLVQKGGAFSEFLAEYSNKQTVVSGGDDETSEKEDAKDEKKEDKKEKSDEKDKLVTEEKRAEGAVKWSIFYTYLRLVSLFPLTLLFLLLSHVADAGGRYWLSLWSQDKPINDSSGRLIVDPALRDERLAVFGSLGLLETAFLLLGSLLMARGATAAAIKIHERLLYGILRSPMSFFERTPVGRIVNRFSQDMRSVDISLQNGFLSVFENILTLISCVVMVMVAMPAFIVVILPLILVFSMIQRYYIATSRQVRRISSTTSSPIYSSFSETLAGIATIRAYDAVSRFRSQANEAMDLNISSSLTSIAVNRWLSFRVSLIGTIAVFSCSLYAVLCRSSLEPGLIGLAVTYAMQISLTLIFFIRSASYVETEIVAVERVLEYADNEPEADWDTRLDKKPDQDWPHAGEIVIQDFATRYRPELDLAVKDLDIHIKAKEKVGVVGRTGAGKSTLSLSLFRIIEPANGRILVDDMDIANIGLHDLRNRLTIIPQDPVLFSGSIRSNLDPFDRESDQRLWQCLDYAHLADYVRSLDAQLDHPVQEGGQNLSVGQRQLLCLGRALLRKTKILVLDEATAAVDLETDSLIQSTIRTQFADCTVITIAHRLNTILDSDRVLVMSEGRVAEFDAPSKLLADTTSMFYDLAHDAGVI